MSAASTPSTTMPSSDAPAASLVSPEQHGLKKHSDGGWGLAPVQTRSARFASFEHSDFPVITGREAVWKLSPIAKFADLLDGELDGSAFPYTATDAAGVSISWIDRTDPRIGTAGKPEERASANAWTSFEKALLIRITGEDATEVTVLRDALGTAARAAHIVIEAAPFSNARIVLDNTGDARIVENVEIIVGESANLSMITVQQWNDGAVHLANHFSRVGRDAKLKHIVVSLGGSVVRLNPTTHLAESGADVEAYGLYFADAGQHLEQQVYVHHEAPHTRSRVNYKGALQGEGARTVWIGDVLIGQQATGTDSYEQNRNLVLSEGTRADSIPNLEIETGDIAGAGHASATGRFDDEQLFYLQSRGIPEEEARRLVVRGFLSEIVQQIGSAPLEERLQAVLEAELVGTAL
ncbi:Fe-S cluster assembly protein SufD [Microterricola pindariensis]|uniref:Fe-S cluster assembly protein SufD n=2 Tax=Microterricola pindariensis TaxID=478010 RepID=A0ABX5B023_9MICO|nr:Fe-S cluster assembly protein SufD [Microterricola pindariensis]